MKYDSVLDQQSISGKIVSLILCVWKPCYVKSGHIYTTYPGLETETRDPITRVHLLKAIGRLDSVEWNGGMEWWNGMECNGT